MRPLELTNVQRAPARREDSRADSRSAKQEEQALAYLKTLELLRKSRTTTCPYSRTEDRPRSETKTPE